MSDAKTMALSICALAVVAHAAVAGSEDDWRAIDARPVPEWWQDAKFGIFIHWGPYSVPAYAPTGGTNVYACYSEWYHGRLLRGQADFTSYHAQNHGGAPYGNFAASFSARFFDPNKWAELFRRAGAKYVVLTSKHHDGYALWPSPESPYYNSAVIGPGRDIAGELTRAVKSAGLKSGFYYSLLEYANPNYPHCERYSGGAIKAAAGASPAKWTREMNIPQMKELVENYGADIIWTDGEWDMTDEELGSHDFLRWLYGESKMRDTIVVNDRWGKGCRGKHGGHYTTEYAFAGGSQDGLSESHPWEECRGIGRSFGFNRFETSEQYMTSDECIRLLVKVVSNGGNLLLNIGPDADGLIPPIMEERLLDVGGWLEVNGEAIYGTRARKRGRRHVSDKVFFTEGRGGVLYAIAMTRPQGETRLGTVGNVSRVSMLGETADVGWRTDDLGLVVSVAADARLDGRHAWVFKIVTEQ